MPKTDGNIVFAAKMDDKEAQKQLSNLRKDIENINKQIAKTGEKKSALAEQLTEARNAAREAEKSLDSLNKKRTELIGLQEKEAAISVESAAREKLDTDIQNAENTLKNAKAAYENAVRLAGKTIVAGTMETDKYAIMEAKANVGKLAEEYKATEANLNSLYERSASYTDSIEQAQDAARGLRDALGLAPDADVSAAIKTTEKELTKAEAQAQKLGDKVSELEKQERAVNAELERQNRLRDDAVNRAGEVERRVAGEAAQIRDTGNAAKETSFQFKDVAKNILKWGFGIRSVFVLMRRLRTYAVEAVKAFAEQDATTKGTINSLKANLAALKGSWGAAFAPIFNAVAPAINALIRMLTSAANAVAAFVALLGGKSTYKKAIANQNALTESISGTGGAAKEAAKYLSGLDEMQKLQEESSGGGGGGGSSSAVDYIDAAVDGWENAGKTFSEKIAGFYDNLTEKLGTVEWEQLGRDIVDGLIGFFDGVEVGDIADSIMEFLGRALGSALALAWGFLSEWADQFWGKISGELKKDHNADGKLTVEDVLENVIDLGNPVNLFHWIDEHIIMPFIKGIVGGLSPESLASYGSYSRGIDWFVLDVLGMPSDQEIIAWWNKTVGIFKDGWELLKVFVSDNIGRGLLQLGIDIANDVAEVFIIGINDIIDAINTLLANHPKLASVFGFDHIDPLPIKLFPDLDPPVGTFYKEKKKEIEARSRRDPIDFKGTIDDDADETYDIFKSHAERMSLRDPVALSAVYGAVKSNLSVSQRTISVLAAYSSTKSSLTDAQKTIGVTASLTALRDSLTSSQKTVNLSGNLTSATDSIPSGQKTINTTAKFTSSTDGLPSEKKTFNTNAKFTTSTNGLGTPSIKSNAYIQSYSVLDSLKYNGNLSVKANVNIVGQTNTPTVKANLQYSNQTKAGGGVFSHGMWHDIARYASGGLAKGSQLFWAREKGPELVGTLGGHTAVMNNNQIVASVASGVAKAIAGIRFQLTGLPAIPALATGSVIPPSITVNFGGAYDLDDIVSRLDALLRGQERPINFTSYTEAKVNGRELFSVVVDEGRAQRTATGRNPFDL